MTRSRPFMTLPAGAALLALAAPGHAGLLIGFEPAESYEAGNVVGQPDNGATNSPLLSNWSATTGTPFASVVTTGGNPGGYLQLTNTGTTNNAAVNFASGPQVAPSDLGIVGTPTYDEQLNFGFDMRLDNYVSNDGTGIASITLRDTEGANRGRVFRLDFRRNGQVTISTSANPFTGGTAPAIVVNNVFTDATSWVNFAGTADFLTNQVTLSIGGSTVNAGNPINFVWEAGSGVDNFGFFSASVGGR
jgi:hypothetical protein